MNRDYLNWLETLPCNRKPQKINTWMGGWAPLPEHVDLSHYEAWQDREDQRNPNGLMARLWRWAWGLRNAERDRRLKPASEWTYRLMRHGVPNGASERPGLG